MRGIFPVCSARTSNGHAVAAAPMSVMKSRRLIALPLGGSGYRIVAVQMKSVKGPAMSALGPIADIADQLSRSNFQSAQVDMVLTRMSRIHSSHPILA
jgi:hypothetical protein